MEKSRGKKIILFLVIAGLAGAFFLFDLNRYFSLVSLKNELDTFRAFYENNKAMTMMLYMLIYIVMAGLSLPGATIMTLAGGAVFGTLTGTILVSFASTAGASIAFLLTRYIFRDFVEKKFSEKLAVINRGIKRQGGFYLFALRLVPIFPFFMINIIMGLTSMRTIVFFLISQVGMLPGTIVYVNAGTMLGRLNSVSGILSPGFILSFALLGVLPFIAKRFISWMGRSKAFSGYVKPKHYDYNLTVIGAGSAGLVASYVAAVVKAKTALVEENKMGGDCLNTGCVPSKALIASAKLASMVKRAEEFGFHKQSDLNFDFANVMERIQSIIRKIEPHDSIKRYTELGVDCYKGRAEIISPFEIRVDDKILRTKNIIIATGAKPMIPDLPGLDRIRYLTSDNIWEIRTLPENLLVLGAGPIGCELAQAFSRLGATVTLVQRGDRIMKKEDPDASEIIIKKFQAEGINVLLNHSAKAVKVTPEEIRNSGPDQEKYSQNLENSGNKDKVEKYLVCNHDGKEVKIKFDEILIALGRSANVEGFGLEKLGIELSRKKTIETNEFLQTNFPNIYCSGDVHGRYQFTHTAAHESWYAAVNALFGNFKKFAVDYTTIPWATFTDPEVARAGLNEIDAEKSGIKYETVKYKLNDLDRAITDSEAHGFVKVLTQPGKDRILGVTIVGNHASDMVAEFVLAMKHGIGLNKILGTIHIYPTMAEANKYAAGLWKKGHAPERLIAWIQKYHNWMRH